MIVDWAIHHSKATEGRPAGIPHVHLLATARFWRARSVGRFGSRQWQWLANADQIRTAEDDWLRTIGMRPSLAA